MNAELLVNSWKSFLDSLPANNDFNSVHQKVTSVTTFTNNSPPSSQKIMDTLIKNQPAIVIAFKAQFGAIQLMHNIFTEGGTLSNPRINVYGLVGNDHFGIELDDSCLVVVAY